MNIRKLVIGGLGVLILIGSFILYKSLAGRDNSPAELKKESAAVVKTIQVNNGTVNSVKHITGRIQSSNRVELYAEVSGVAKSGRKAFKTGTSFSSGEIFLYIDNSEFKSSLISTKSQFISSIANVLPDIRIDFSEDYQAWADFLAEFDINNKVQALPEVKNKQLKLFLTGRGIYTSYFKIQEAETRLDKFTMKAPFNGTLTESYINEGTLVRVGQQLGEFINTSDYEIEASVKNSLLPMLKIGSTLPFKEIGTKNTFEATLIRINEKVDPGTQLVKIFFRIKDKKLKSGMYLEANLPITAYQNAFELPLSSLVDEEYVFSVDKGVAKKTKIVLNEKDTENIIVSGLKDKTVVILDKKNSSFDGSSVIEM